MDAVGRDDFLHQYPSDVIELGTTDFDEYIVAASKAKLQEIRQTVVNFISQFISNAQFDVRPWGVQGLGFSITGLETLIKAKGQRGIVTDLISTRFSC